MYFEHENNKNKKFTTNYDKCHDFSFEACLACQVRLRRTIVKSSRKLDISKN